MSSGEKRKAVKGIPSEEKSGTEKKMAFELTKINVSEDEISGMQKFGKCLELQRLFSLRL